MFESDDWILESTFNDVDEKPVPPQSREQGGEKLSPVKRRKVNNCETALADNTVTSKPNATESVPDDNFPCSSKSRSRKDLLLNMVREKPSPESRKKSAKEINRYLSSLLEVEMCSSNETSKPNTTSAVACKKSKEKNHIKFPSKAKSGERVKFVRIFPGPAGLVPDRTSSDGVVKSRPNGEVESESKTIIKHIETELPKSQDDKNLFSEKAWNLLLIDLPCHFFKEYGISVIKSKADSSHCNSMKVKFVAGILECIDHSHDDPLVTLKDSTGSIEGTIHRNILLKYPGVLDPNVVILAQDVGLLKTRTYVVTNKYHIFISQKNLLAIYSNKGRIVSTPQVDSVLSKIVIDENCDSTPFRNESSVDAIAVASASNSHRVNKISSRACKTDSGRSGTANGDFKQFPVPASIADLDLNDFFSTDCEFGTEEQDRSAESSRANSQPCEVQQRGVALQNTSRAGREPAVSNKQISSHVKQTADPPDGHETQLSTNDGAAQEARRDSSAKPAKASLVSYFTGDNEYDTDDEMLSQLDVDNV